MRSLIREGLASLLALALWPICVFVAAAVLIRRAIRGQPLVKWHDLGRHRQKVAVAIGAALTLWLIGTVLVAFASIFVRIPDI
jgi:hypothetical protein